MKKYFMITGLCALTALTGCAANDKDEAGILHKSGNTIYRVDQNELYNENGVKNNGNEMSNFGYVRHQKSPIPGDANVYNTIPKLDREAVADLISKIVTQLPNVNDVGTLVTDEEVLIVYDTDSKDRNLTADQVKRSALSIVPRYFHVYVSDDPKLMDDISNFGRLDANSRDINTILEPTIQKMLKSPQGYRVSEGENENGEIEGGLNPEYDLPARERGKNSQVNQKEKDIQKGAIQGNTETGDTDSGNPETKDRDIDSNDPGLQGHQ